MFNDTDPIEISHNYKLVRVVRMTDEHLTVRLTALNSDYEEEYAFSRATGVLAGQELVENPMRIRPKSDTIQVPEFRINTGIQDWPKAQWKPVPGLVFTDGGEAANIMRKWNEQAAESDSPFRYMVKRTHKEVDNPDWKKWMQFRFESGEYEPTPWNTEDWYQPFADRHFLHLSKEDPCKVAFVASDEHGLLDTVTQMAPGRYLAKYFPQFDSKEQSRLACLVDVDAELKFASTEDDIERVYLGGVSSCMAHPVSDFSTGGIHPTRIYGAGDLAIAYLERKKRISGRALCWPEKKVYGRIYGDENRMIEQLQAAGFRRADPSDFVGARLKRIFLSSSSGFVMPYLDWDLSATDDGEFLRLAIHGRIYGQNTHGTSGESSYQTCHHCEGGVHEEDAYYLSDRDVHVCESCFNNHYYNCGHCTDNFDPERTPSTEVIDRYNNNSLWCEHCTDDSTVQVGERRYADNHPDVRYCDECDDHYLPADADAHTHEDEPVLETA